MDVYKPVEMVERAVSSGISKAEMSWKSLLPLSFLAGMYIAFGALSASIVSIGMAGVWPYGIMKIMQGLVFSLGLILVVLGGAELFTGNSLMIMAFIKKKISLRNMLRNWGIVYLGNFAGSLTLVLLVVLSKEYQTADGALGSIMLSTAQAKVQYGFGQALFLGILCNILVCLAVWLTYSARSAVDKVAVIVFPITAFIAAGFEHSVANMYIIPLGILIKGVDPSFVTSLARDFTNLNWSAFFLNNLLPVTLGNIIGGTVFVGLLNILGFRKN